MKSNSQEPVTRQSLQALLKFLGRGGEETAVAYESLRRRLVKVLEIRVIEHRLRAAPEDLADETIYRVASKLEEGLEIRTSDPFRYFYGVGRNILQEVARQERMDGNPLDEEDLSSPEPESEPAEAAFRRRCLDECLRRLSASDRELILLFHAEGQGKTKIRHRKQLAASLGLTPNALRIKAHRIRRKQLEPCVAERLLGEWEM